ncbi:hypothetical protein B0H16DRAFT_1514265 [Mycena metata]|uniref:Knr4/Smi1-like domain-containing protein n=1 Tax=Mycena metata TaxID=1033252 RepID=A0AAD7NR36_9AGAR|nr:hypothetical protein B0H16DRAFT_1514265 [Mycena metata]
MGWFTNLFSPAASNDQRKGQALNSTHDAFSLRTSSPVFGAHPDAFNPDTLDPQSAAGPSYTYPPQESPKGSPAYGYVPTSGGSRHSSLLPTHHDALHTPPYPPLEVTWNRLRTWLAREYPELGDTLNYGILPQDLALLESQFGFDLPQVVRESYLTVDGQEAESSAGCSQGLFFGLTLLPLEDVLDEWRFWREVDDDPSTGANVTLRDSMQSIPTGWVRKEYSQRGWIPLVADKAGNYVGIDLNPDEGGSPGQVIVFGRDFDTKIVLWAGDGPAGWAKWLGAGEGFELGGGDNSEEDEDDLGYESYFYDGNGRGQGDGGGDNGAGLRLAGEYRGWNVLEAWADRSIRKWYELGLVTEPIGPPEDEKSETTPPLPPSTHVPLESISRGPAPAPLPVDLPTQNEIDIDVPPSPTDSPRSSFHDDDLERGLGPGLGLEGVNLGMREIASSPAPFLSRRSSTPPPHNALASGSTPPPAAAAQLIPDLLADSESNSLVDVDVAPTAEVLTPEPVAAAAAASVPASPSPVTTPTAPLVTMAEAPPTACCGSADTRQRRVLPKSEEAVVVDGGEAAEADADAVDPDVTIRLVGGGGIAGAADEPASSDFTLEDGDGSEVDTDAESISSQTSVPAPAADSAESTTQTKAGGKKHKHKKTMSGGLAGLKKLGMGALRKKDSSASIKEEATAVAA